MKLKAIFGWVFLALGPISAFADNITDITVGQVTTDARSGNSGLYSFTAKGLPSACSDGTMWVDGSMVTTPDGYKSLLSVVLTAKSLGATVNVYYNVKPYNNATYCYAWQIAVN